MGRPGSSADKRGNEYSGEGGYRKSFLVENLGHTEWIPENSLGKYAIYFNNINNTY